MSRLSRLFFLPVLALLAVTAVGFSSVVLPAPTAAKSFAKTTSGVINGPGAIVPGCGATYQYTGSEPGGFVFVGGQPGSVTMSGSGTTAYIETGNQIVFFTLGYCDLYGNLLAQKQVSVKNTAGAYCGF